MEKSSIEFVYGTGIEEWVDNEMKELHVLQRELARLRDCNLRSVLFAQHPIVPLPILFSVHQQLLDKKDQAIYALEFARTAGFNGYQIEYSRLIEERNSSMFEEAFENDKLPVYRN